MTSRLLGSAPRHGRTACPANRLCILLCVGVLLPGITRSAPEEVGLIIRPTIRNVVTVPQFGDSLAMQDRLVFVGDPRWDDWEEGDDAIAGRPGAVHIYDFSNPAAPIRRSRFFAADAQTDGYFGTSVAVSGNLVLVGAPRQEFIGAAYLFDISNPNNPVELAKLVATDRVSNSDFGKSVAIDGDLALIGTPGDGSVSGAAYLFDISNPSSPVEKAKITAQTPANGDQFGRSVALDAGTSRVLIGAPSGTGFAEIHDITTLTSPSHVSTVNATTDESSGNQFGMAVDLSATAALVGAPGRDDVGVGMDTGAAYLFDLATPSSPSGVQIIATDRGARHRLGYVLQLSGNNAVIGATGTLSGLDGVIGYHFDISNLSSPVQSGKLLPGRLRLFYQDMGIAMDRNFAVLAPVNDTDNSRTPAASLFKLFDPETDLSHGDPVTGIPSMILPGQSFTIDSSVSNEGNVASGDFVIGIHFSLDDSVTTSDPRVDFLNQTSVDPGATVPFSRSVTIPSGFRLGNYYVGSLLDSTRQVAETDETNNSWVSSTQIMVGTPEAILKQDEIDVVDRSIASAKRKMKSEKRKLKKAKKAGNRRLAKKAAKNIRKWKARIRALSDQRAILVDELDQLLTP